MKFLFLFSTLFPMLAFATSPAIPAYDADAQCEDRGESHYRGTGVLTTAEGIETKAAVELETVRWDASPEGDSGMLFIYRVNKYGKDYVYAFIIKPQRNGFFKVFVPIDASVTESDDIVKASLTKFRESGWGHKHSYRGKHGYKKISLFLNYVYTNGDRIDHNIVIKKYDDGRRKLYTQVSGGTDAEGLHYVWMDKMEMLPATSD